ncbi:peptidoglycan -binding protein [Falsihalocynthiibacter sp. S25ZX9]|uniref:peptidoglycan -binding protein n=1 Tax=Falsihalocynthiibacter sp. S25ZX9 TaxID=3240870 RepID=UPI003510C8BD
MALSRRTGQRFQGSIWPGFVDAMTALLLVLMFVLTIFMVVQSVLRETISGQETELDELTSQVLSLAEALGLEQTTNQQLQSEVVRLSSNLLDARDAADIQASMIASLTVQNDAQSVEISARKAAIASFEAQVATLLAQRNKALADGTALATTLSEAEQEKARLISEQEALQLALASVREEVDQGAEAARLAAAKREALEALIADLQVESAREKTSLAQTLARLTEQETLNAGLSGGLLETQSKLDAVEAARLAELATAEALRLRLDTAATALSEEEAARLAEAAAAQALRDRLANADDEITAMSLALEAKRQEAEDTLTLLAAANDARGDLDERLAAALAAKILADKGLSAQGAAAQTLETQLAAALLAGQNSDDTLENTKAKLANAEASLALLQEKLAQSGADEDDMQKRLLAALAAKSEVDANLNTIMTEAEQRSALLKVANDRLSAKEAESAESQRKMAVLNEQVTQLRAQLGSLQSVLDASAAIDGESKIQLQALGSQLNQALARVASEEKKRRALEEAERKRLEAEAEILKAETKNLARYRSEFFGRLRDLLGTQEGMRIDGDRFVFSSEVLFETGAVELSEEGKGEVAKVAAILRSVVDQIPPEIDWVIRVDGHTDDTPLLSNGKYSDNWELSQGRALSVVRYLVDALDIPPSRLAANGFGEYQPVNTDDTPEARAQNRRIELKFTEK